jgi:cytochrome P450
VYYLLKNPKTLEKLQAEILHRYQAYDEIDASSSTQLPYLQAVIAEALRIHPPGSQGFPRVSPGCQIDGVWVPKGVSFPDQNTTIFLNLCENPRFFFKLTNGLFTLSSCLQAEVYTSAWAVTHDPSYFHEPMAFKPERWLDPSCSDTKEASQPFSLGFRACIGRK